MGELVDDILEAMVGAGEAVAEANRRDRRLRPLEDRVAALEHEVRTLQRTVATMAHVLAESGALGALERRQILDAARRARHDVRAEVEDETEAAGETPYRGAGPGGGCAVCGKALAEDDPELTLAARGRVCALCFTRGG